MSYGVWIEPQYYAGGLNNPRPSWAEDEYGPLRFDTMAAAEAKARELNDQIRQGRYDLAHNEYARPEISARHVPS